MNRFITDFSYDSRGFILTAGAGLLSFHLPFRTIASRSLPPLREGALYGHF
jgi:hypothetical protein